MLTKKRGWWGLALRIKKELAQTPNNRWLIITGAKREGYSVVCFFFFFLKKKKKADSLHNA